MTSINKTNFQFRFLALVILFAALSRLIPHAPNFTPVIAIALFGGTYFDTKIKAFFVPLLAMLLSDFCLAIMYGYSLFSEMRLVIYITFIAITAIGLMIKNVSIKTVGTAALAASILFFITSNFMVWLSGKLYPHNMTGLITCFVAAIPYFKNTLLSSAIYSGILYGGFEIAKHKLPSLELKNTQDE